MKTKRILFWVVIAIALAIFVVPILWIYFTSFKSTPDIMMVRILSPATLDNYRYVFSSTTFLLEYRNTLIVSVASTALVMLVSLPAGYSFARWNTGGGTPLFITISTRMFPGIVAAIPFFNIFRALGLMDTHIGIVLLYLYFNMSFATFLLFGFFREIPRELEDAAMVDGYSRMEVFRRIIFPLIKPGAAITAVFCLVFAWNEFLFTLLFTRLTARTLTLGLSSYWTTTKIMWGEMGAALGLAIIPTLIAAWFMQRYIVRGLTFGAVKG